MTSSYGPKVLSAAYHGKLDKLHKYLEKEDPTLLECESVDYQDEAGTTPLHAACQEGHAACVSLLLRVGAIVDKPGAGGITPLILACENQRIDCVMLLLEAKASPAAKDSAHGASPLHSACQAGALELVQLLVKARAPIDAVDNNGASPLIIAAYAGHAACVERLLGAGADDAIKYEGKTALELAEEAEHAACVALLDGSHAQAQQERKLAEMFPKGAPEDQEELIEGADGIFRPKSKVAEKAAGEAEQKAGGGTGAADAGADAAATSGGGGFLENLQKQLKESGLQGAELIAEKQQELAEQDKALEEAKTAREQARLDTVARLPTTASDAKSRANAFFGAGKVADAAEMYEKALELLEAAELAAELTADGKEDDKEDGKSEGKEEAEAEAVEAAAIGTAAAGSSGGSVSGGSVSGGSGASSPRGVTEEPVPQRAVLHANLAACQLRQRQWRLAVASCDAACDLDPHYTKALYRRAQAKRALKEYEGALADASAARAALCRAGGGTAPIGEAGRKTAAEIDRFCEAVTAEESEGRTAAARQQLEEFGLTLGGAEGSEDEPSSVYYHHASQGDKTQDFMWWMRLALREAIQAVRHDVAGSEWQPSNGYPASVAAIAVSDFDPDAENEDESRGKLEGHCTIRSAKGRRAMFFDLSIEVPWKCALDQGTPQERTLRGNTRVWNITHCNELLEWRHLNSRNTRDAAGPAADALAERLPPAIAAKLKFAVQQVLMALVNNRIDPAAFAPPPKPKPPSRGWGKGTVDYSKWDALDDDDDDDERLVEMS